MSAIISFVLRASDILRARGKIFVIARALEIELPIEKSNLMGCRLLPQQGIVYKERFSAYAREFFR